MQALRAFLHRHRLLAVALVAAALWLKALVPAGYMPALNGKVITVSICADASTGGAVTRQIVVPRSGAPAEDGGAHGKACPYAPLGLALIGGADAVLLALALAFILALGLVPSRAPALRRRSFLRPPLRGPPALA